MQHEKKYWEGLLNGDDADAFVQFTEYINCKDFRFGTTSDKGFAKQLESVGGTALIPNGFIDETNITIGYAKDEPNNRVVFFNYSSIGDHGIYCYDFNSNVIYKVLGNAQVTGGLNFNKDHIIHSARIVNGCVYWTDNFNEPRRINIDAGINLNQPFALERHDIVVNNVVSTGGGFLQNLYSFDTDFLFFTANQKSAMAPNVYMYFKRTGTAGSFAQTTNLFIPIDWSAYPATPYWTILGNAISSYLLTIDASGTQWSVVVTPVTPTVSRIQVNISQTWDWATGDASFAPTVSLDLLLTQYETQPYQSPVSQSVISWIRRQPGLPLLTFKQTLSTRPILIADEAFLFSYRYTYQNGEISTLSGFSALQNFNRDPDAENSILVLFPAGEKIDQDVIQIDVVATYLISGVSFIVQTWRTIIASDEMAILNHNAGITFLNFNFDNNVAGTALDAAYSNKIFDSVPLMAATIEFAKNRAFMANLLAGYDSPGVTSLAFTTTGVDYDASGGAVTGRWYLLRYKIGPLGSTNSVYVLYTTTNLNSYPPTGTYWFTYSGSVPPFPATVNFATLTFRGATFNDMVHSFGAAAIAVSYTDQGVSSVIISGSPPTSGVVGRVFKANASYRFSISFKDNYGRECGVVLPAGFLINTPDTGLSTYTYINAVNWTLNNTNATLEIPPWAYYYSINATKCLKTRFFIEGLGTVIYAAKDSSNNYTFTTTVYASDLAGVAIDLTFLSSYSQGYVFAVGDQVELFVNGAIYNLAAIGQSAQWLICSLENVGGLSAQVGTYQIYTPYQPQLNEPHYEVGQIFPIINPGTNLRQYSTLSGTINGDVTVFKRVNSSIEYFTEAMSPNDKFYKYWFTDAGRPNYIDYIGQRKKPYSYSFSNAFISGTLNNGLSTFDALDAGDIGADFGPIQKLQLASKVQKIGTVMLAICSGPSTASLYLGENTLISQTGDSVVAQANTVVGSIHELKGGFGTVNPESVIEYRGNIYWYDAQNGKVIQYAENGLFPISNYKLSRFWKLFSDQYNSLDQQDIEDLGSRPFVFGCADPHHEELLFTVPRVLYAPPNGFLPDYPGTPYPFDIWDGQGKTIVYKLMVQPNRWQGSYSFEPEMMFYMENDLFSFKTGQLYLHNQSASYCQYYGVQYFPAIMDLSNQQLNKPRVPENYSSESNRNPMWVYVMTRYPYIQATDMLSMDFSNKEGLFYSNIMKNKLDPRFNNNYGQALLEGESVRATALYIMSQWDPTQGIVQVKFINIGYTVSLGQPV